MVRLNDGLGRLPRGAVWLLCATILLLDFAGDVATGVELSWSIFYVIPVAIAAWHLGWRPALIMSVAAAACLLGAEVLAGATYSIAVAPYWNVFARSLFFLLVAAMLTLLKQSLEHEREVARTDWLTGLPNIRSFLETAGHEIIRARRSRRPLTMAYIDLDGFKQVNDRHGHAVGDDLLRQVAGVLRSRLRNVDIVARLGGDEFAILFPETGLAEAEQAVARLRPAMGELVAAGGWAVRFSMGAVAFHKPPADVEELIRSADRAMYEAKRRGGDQVVLTQHDGG